MELPCFENGMYQIKISNGKKRTYNFRKELFDMGLVFNPANKCYEVYTEDESAIARYRAFCKAKKLKISVADTEYKRNSKYRDNYMEAHMDDKIHICAYCGWPIKKENITIDHIFPVDRTSKNLRLQRQMKKFGIEDINSEKNLCVAHKSCNSRKGSKTGIWVFKGFLGKIKALWVVRWVIRAVIAFVLAQWWLVLLQEYLRLW